MPCYNEAPEAPAYPQAAPGGQDALETLRSARSGDPGALECSAPVFLGKLLDLVARGAVSDDSRVCLVDDGSTDATWELIRRLAALDPHFAGISLSHNQGHQRALLAGLMEARAHADVAVSMDCDGQDDINAVDAMLDEYRGGCDVVYGVRSSRGADTAFKRLTARAFYRLMARMGVETVYDHADYRLMSKRALDMLAEWPEANVYLRGIVPRIGLRSARVPYERRGRVAGQSHYPLRKMAHLAVDGITSFSVKPLHLVFVLGVAFSLLGLAGVVWAVASFLAGSSVAGWASTTCAICLMGGVQLLSLGVIGEYVGRVYLEAKRRPRYQVAERTWEDSCHRD